MIILIAHPMSSTHQKEIKIRRRKSYNMSSTHQKEIKIRRRKSYKMFKEFYDAGARREVLELLNHELNARNAYGSNTAALYARESLNLFITDFNI